MANGKNIQLLVAVLSLLIDGGLSTTATDASCSDVGQVQYVQVFEVGSTLVVVWQAPVGSDDCGLAYNVTYSSRLSTHTDITEELHYTFDYNSYPCDLGQISITPVIEGGEMENAVHIEEYSADIGGVSNITFHQEDGLLHVTWSDPPNTDLCEFVYQIEYVDENNYTDVVESYGREFTFESDLTPCLISNLTITPLSGTKMGLSTSKTHEADVGPVKNFVLNSSNGELFAKWDPPANTHMCILSYEVAQNETGCFTKSINVKAISNSGKQGMVQSGEIETEIPAVTNLDVQFSNGLVTISWVRPENVGDCDVKYAVQFDEGGIYDTYDTSLIIEANPLLCQTARATVWPVSSTGNFGVQASANYEREIGSVKALSLKPNGDQLLATWAPPADSELCTFSYLLEYNDGSGTRITVTDDTSFSFGYSTCNGAEITVTAHTASGLMGAETHAKCEEVSDIGPVTNLMIQNVGGMLEITWQSPHNANEFGPITYKVNYNGEDHQASDTAYTVDLWEMPDPTSCSVVVFIVSAVTDSGEGLGVAIQYHTGVGEVTGLTSEILDNGIQLSWSPPEVVVGCGDVIGYKVNYNGEDHTVADTMHTVDLSEISTDPPSCSVFVFTVIAVTASGEGLGVAIKYNTGVGEVTGLTIEKVEDGIKLSWLPVKVDENCGELTAYKVNYNGEDYTVTEPEHTVGQLEIAGVPACVIIVFTVTAVADFGEGLGVAIKYNTGVGEVTGLTIEKVEDGINLSWLPVEVNEDCGELIGYKVNYNGEIHTVTDPEHLVGQLEIVGIPACSIIVFTVTAVADFGEGLGVAIEYNTDCPEDATVH